MVLENVSYANKFKVNSHNLRFNENIN